MNGETEHPTKESESVAHQRSCSALIDALEWALAMEPSPCRCMGVATHVCRAHKALELAYGREMEVCDTCAGYGFLDARSEKLDCPDCAGRGLRWSNDEMTSRPESKPPTPAL